jgi:hypothetical protein
VDSREPLELVSASSLARKLDTRVAPMLAKLKSGGIGPEFSFGRWYFFQPSTAELIRAAVKAAGGRLDSEVAAAAAKERQRDTRNFVFGAFAAGFKKPDRSKEKR